MFAGDTQQAVDQKWLAVALPPPKITMSEWINTPAQLTAPPID